jgi:hypothetical protein
MTPPHVETCFSNNPNTGFDGCSAGEPRDIAAFCAYHQNTVLPTMLFYANDPYDADNPRCQDGNYPNGISDGAINGGLSHEHVESITDPIPNDAWTNGSGAFQGFEVGDQCNRIRGNPLGTAPNGAKYNQVINGHFYWYISIMTVVRSSSSEFASRYCSSVSGKCSPMSPSAAAPNSASMIACVSTSASE